MKQFSSKEIRNVVLLGHGSSGKTSLAEAMLYASGTSQRLGSIASGTTICDCDPEEIRRHMSIFLTVAPIEWNGCKINILDAPGQPDFEGEVVEGLRAADCAVIAVSGKSGIHVGTELAWEKVREAHMPAAFFISKLDEEQADFYKVLEELKSTFGAAVCPLIVPFDEGGTLTYINIITKKAYRYDKGKPAEVPLPDTGNKLDELIAAISEAVAETSDELFDKYFSGEAFTEEELTNGILNGFRDGTISPVFCGSSVTGAGIDMFLNGITSLFPSADTKYKAKGADGGEVTLNASNTEPLAAFVFKTVADPYVGKLSYVRVYSGQLKPETIVVNSRTGKPERVGKLCLLRGKKQIETAVIGPGDIGAIAKMNTPKTGDTLCEPTKVVSLPEIRFPRPCLSMAIKPVKKGDEEKISLGLHRLMEEDQTITYETNPETREQILSGLGELHIDITVSKLKSKFGADVTLSTPEVAYRETIRKKVKCEGKHKKQTGGHGQYGHVIIEFEPSDSEELVFEEKVFGGSVPKNYFPAVEKGLREAVSHGVIAGYPVVNIKATLLDGSYHPVDSSEMAFKTAAALALKAALPQASPVLLEPYGLLKVNVQESALGDVIGEINKRRGRVLGMDHIEGGREIIQAEAPIAEMHDFSVSLRAITQGRGSFTFEFLRYEEAPPQVAQAVAAARSAQSAG
ncbi:hypothetical protein CCDG5_0584 [[Clostridium] cellulosi]|uniref:Tr-type G domain-containing protein n=1 Tax=[Clostridium] cellulosi TaxID=29343 RepID=A0A078KRD1_9FIRM|nr:hypothetical protein CCDG5_0584 [[Clostridium] cellulosi]